jgi:hypothetical protein
MLWKATSVNGYEYNHINVIYQMKTNSVNLILNLIPKDTFFIVEIIKIDEHDDTNNR